MFKFGPKKVPFSQINISLADNKFADQLIGSVGLSARAVSRKTPIYFISLAPPRDSLPNPTTYSLRCNIRLRWHFCVCLLLLFVVVVMLLFQCRVLVLQYVEMPIVSRPDCQEDYSGVNGVDEGMICGGIDEGGETQVGIISANIWDVYLINLIIEHSWERWISKIQITEFNFWWFEQMFWQSSQL